MAFAHLHRYGTRKKKDEVTDVEVRGDGVVSARGKLWDLRKGAPAGTARDFYASGDGRACAYDGAEIVAVQKDGSRVRLAFPERPAALRVGSVFWVGDFIVARDTHADPWIVMNAKTGAPVNRLSRQRKQEHGYYPNVTETGDGETLLFCDAVGIQRVDVATATVTDVFAAPAVVSLVACARTRGGDWVLVERPKGGDDAVVVRDAKGHEKARLKGCSPSFQIRRLGERILVTHREGFVVVDDALEAIARVPFVDDDTFARTIPLPSGREWIAIGGYGQWDHYGETSLAPKDATPAPKEKATAKKKSRG